MRPELTSPHTPGGTKIHKPCMTLEWKLPEVLPCGDLSPHPSHRKRIRLKRGNDLPKVTQLVSMENCFRDLPPTSPPGNGRHYTGMVTVTVTVTEWLRL